MDKLLSCLDRQFAELHSANHDLIKAIPADLLYRQPPVSSNLFPVRSCGEYILRAAAAVEQTFGGITSNLWDDPFEWTLPENLTTPEKVGSYLDEVEATRRHGFEFFESDKDLLKEIMAPAGATLLFPLLLDTLVRAASYQGGAQATLNLLTAKPTG
ncbi:MAG: hypothetical protein AABM67_17850 [Acidobacteriota bacterium]